MKLLSIFVILLIGSVNCESEEDVTVVGQSGTPEVMEPKSDEILSFTELDNDVHTYNPKDCTLKPPPELDEITAFYEWSDSHNKVYKTPQEKICKLVRVIYHMREVKAHNELYAIGRVSYKRDLTQYSDLTHDEKLDILLMHDVQTQPQVRQAPETLPVFPPARGCVDWRNEGIVTPAGRQNKCASCYAWSGAAALEGQLKKCGIFDGSISTQAMVDCPAVGVYGCKSGWPFFVFRYQMTGGIFPASKYPYLDKQGKCSFNKADIVGYVDTPYKFDFTAVNGNASFIQQVVSAVGPVSISICVEKSFLQYKSGIYDVPTCCKDVKHTVAIVGFGTDVKFGDFWIIKNSWGESWGEKGFAKIARGKNLCISETQIQYARVKDVNGKVCPLY